MSAGQGHRRTRALSKRQVSAPQGRKRGSVRFCGLPHLDEFLLVKVDAEDEHLRRLLCQLADSCLLVS
jgi:hypothetical protein